MTPSVTSALTVAAEKSSRFADPTMAAAERSVTSSGGLLQIFFSLVVVLAAVFVVAWVVRRMKVTPRSRVGHLKVIDEVVLGSKERAIVLEAEGTRLVVGVGEGRVALLHRYTSTETPDVAVETAAGPSAKAPSFLEVLKKGLGQ
jgi:flagellar protein FliO/FliZ